MSAYLGEGEAVGDVVEDAVLDQLVQATHALDLLTHKQTPAQHSQGVELSPRLYGSSSPSHNLNGSCVLC